MLSTRNLILLPARGGGGGILVYLLDTFSGAAAELDAHTPDIDLAANGWVEDTQDWDTNGSGSAVITDTAGAGRFATVDVAQADGVITLTVTSPATGDAYFGLIFRYTDTNNRWTLFVNGASGEFTLTETTGGSSTNRDTTAVTISANTQYIIEVTLAGNSIAATLDGANDLSYSSATHASVTKHGLVGLNGGTWGQSKYDEFGMTT